MIKDIIIVDSLSETIRSWGIEFMNNTIFQELGGQYWFVDVNNKCPCVEAVIKLRDACDDCEYCELPLSECPVGYNSKPKVECEILKPGDNVTTACFDCLKPIPLKIAWLITEFIRFQRQGALVGIPTQIENPPKMRAYVPIGMSFSVDGKQTEPTEIPAKLGVIHIKEK